MSKLDDFEQTVIYIPCDGGDEEDVEPGLPSVSFEHDLDGGPQLRFDAYKVAWTRCLDRVKVIITELYAPVVEDVMDRLGNIYADVLPGLPFPELPVITVTDPSGGSLFLDHLAKRLEPEREHKGGPSTLVHHLYPSDCPNIASAMKNLISGFIDRDADGPKRKPAASLAAYDLGWLQAWFAAVAGKKPNLVVLLHDFEQFDKNVVEDVFYICSLEVARLPLTFILLLSTPSPSSYLQAVLTRATLTLIRAYHFVVPSGRQVLDTILFKTFFDPSFELHLLPGPDLLGFIENYHEAHNPSLDALLTVLQVAHLSHFTANMFSLLSHATPPIPPRPTPAELVFLQLLLGRLVSGTSKKTASDWRAQARSPSILLQAVDGAREAFSRHARRTKLGFSLLHIVVGFLVRAGRKEKLLERWRGAAAISKALEGDGVVGLAGLLQKLSGAELKDLLAELHEYFQCMPLDVCNEETAGCSKIVTFQNASVLPVDEVVEWLENYLAELLQPFEESTPLWDVWYTAHTPFPMEVINPALRPSIIAGLSFPHSFTRTEEQSTKEDIDEDEEEDLQMLPDTSILFKGYSKAGKMINVYDWFDAFRVVLEGQRRAALDAAAKASPGKGKRGKAKAKVKREDPTLEDDEEQWRLGVQARFVRALHELDHLGFIKHTSRGGGGRKGEYVLRTVLGVLE